MKQNKINKSRSSRRSQRRVEGCEHNKKSKLNKSGYILVLTLMILSVLVVVVTSMFFNETAHSALTKTIVDREKAKMLALGGLQLAISKLTIIPDKKSKEQKEVKEQKEKKETEPKGKEQAAEQKNEVKLLAKILPSLNRWQTVNLNEANDGINGTIKFSISSENGKININQLYDFSKHKFIGAGATTQFNAQKFLTDISAKIRDYAQKDIFRGLQQFLQNRKFPLNDVTELLEIPEFAYFKDYVFYEPSSGEGKQKRPIFLTDIFTTWTSSYKLQPWVLSDSVSDLFGLNRSQAGDMENRKKLTEQGIKNFKPNIQWKTEWDKVLKPIYGREFNTLNKQIEFLFESQFGPKTFSVVSYGTVGDVTQRIFAIVEIVTSGNNEVAVVKIKKLYWI